MNTMDEVLEQERKPQCKSRLQRTPFRRSYRSVAFYSPVITQIVVNYLVWKQVQVMQAQGMSVELVSK